MAGSEKDTSANTDAMTPILGVSRILVIESDEEERAVLVRFLAAQGFRVDQAGDGEEGLYRAHEAETPYDVVLLDDHLPDATGLEMLPALRAATPESLTVFMSESSDRQRFFEAMACGAYEFLQKPPWLQEALRVVTRGIREQRARRMAGVRAGGDGHQGCFQAPPSVPSENSPAWPRAPDASASSGG